MPRAAPTNIRKLLRNLRCAGCKPLTLALFFSVTDWRTRTQEDEEGWQTDRHGFVRFPRQVMSNLASLPFRRLDGMLCVFVVLCSRCVCAIAHSCTHAVHMNAVQLDCFSRWMVHDAFLKKRIKDLLPDAGESSEQFLRLLVGIVAVDVNGECAAAAE